MSSDDHTPPRRRIAIDVSALRESAPFRLLFAAHLASSIGSQITVVALMYQAWQISGSSLAVGGVGLAQVVPTVAFALVGGSLADKYDRKRLLLMVQVVLCCTSLALAALATSSDQPLWLLYLLAAVSAGFSSVDGPARSAVIPMLVSAATLRSAVQLREVLTQSGRTLGPLIGGAVIATAGLQWAYIVDAATFAFAFLMFTGLPSLKPEKVSESHIVRSIIEGLQYVRRAPILASTFAADLIAMIMGLPRALFPALAATVFLVDETGLGALYAAPAAGALLAVFVGGWTSHVRREGRAVLLCIAAWGAAIMLFGLTTNFVLALVLLGLAGAADTYSAIFRQTILLATVPDEFRGRMSSVHIMVVTGGPPLGDFEAGAAAEVFGIRTSILIGGAACIAGMGVIAWRVPAFARWVDPARA